MSEGSQDSVEMVIGHENGQVFMRFREPMRVVVFDPQNCIDVARCMTDSAFEAREGVKPLGDSLKSELVERHRMTLTQRLSLMLGTMRGDTTISDGKVAQALVEACLREIF